MEHLHVRVEEAREEAIRAKEVAKAESLMRDLKASPMRRGVKLVDRSGRAAVGIGDPEQSPAPTFYLNREQFEALYSAEWTDYDPNLLAPPFHAFYIRPEAPLANFATRELEADDDQFAAADASEVFIGLFLFSEDVHFWIIGDISESHRDVGGVRIGRIMESFIARTNEDLCVADCDINGDGSFVGLSICDRARFQGVAAPYTGSQKAARALVMFLLMLNNRDVVVNEIQPTNRAERKRRAREGSAYRIHIPRSVNVLVTEVQERRNLGVEQHIRSEVICDTILMVVQLGCDLTIEAAFPISYATTQLQRSRFPTG